MRYLFTYYNTLTTLRWSCFVSFDDEFYVNLFYAFIYKVMADMPYLKLSLELYDEKK